MKLLDITTKLNELYPESLKASYDNVGLMVGSLEKDIKNVYIALDLTREVMDDALKMGADLIITHHPLLFHPLYSINTDKDPGSIIRDLIKSDMALYSLHTNFDSVRMNDLLGTMLKITNQSLLSEKENCGIIGDSSVTNFSDFISLVKKVFNLKEVEYVGNPDIEVKRVALCAGSGSSMMNDAYNKSADIYLTGDLSYSRALEAKRMGLNILVIPHYVEHLFSIAIKEDLENLSKFNIHVSEIDPNPFKRY